MAARIYCVMFLIIGRSVLGAPQEKNLRPKGESVETRYCAFYNGSQPTCDPNDPICVPTIHREACPPVDSDKTNYCFQLWQYNSITNSSTPRVKGCFVDVVPCNERSSPCLIHNIKMPLITCCCSGDMCNTHNTLPDFILRQLTESRQETSTANVPSSDTQNRIKTKILESIFNIYSFLNTVTRVTP